MSEGSRIAPDLLAAGSGSCLSGGFVTCHNAEQVRRAAAAGRKAEQRARDAQAGVVELRVRLEPGVAVRLALAQQIRGGARRTLYRNRVRQHADPARPRSAPATV